jgi:ribose-phosphate pyrophosphokinase
MDLHASQLQGFFDIPVDHLYAINVLSEYFKERQIGDLVIVSPDVGGIKMARAYAKRLNAGLAIVDKRRMSPEKTEVMHILGEVKGKNVVMVDDIIATAGSLVDAVHALKSSGAKGIYAAASHGVFSGPADERIAGCKELIEVVVTNSIPLSKDIQNPKIKQLSIAPLLAEAITRTHNAESISSLFEEIRN